MREKHFSFITIKLKSVAEALKKHFAQALKLVLTIYKSRYEHYQLIKVLCSYVVWALKSLETWQMLK